jgi:uncharacterized protein (TIGR02001 family)
VPARARWRATRTRRCPARGAALQGVIAFWLLLLAADVCAQVSGSATLVSDYLFRGITLSENKPAAQFAVAYDDRRGWYGGAFASTARFIASSTHNAHIVPFFGYASRLSSGLTWEAGVDYSAFAGFRRYNYAEAYLGLTYESFNGRVYYSPRYFGQDSGAIYGELNFARPLLDRIRLIAHVGTLWSSGGFAYYGQSDRRLSDARLGIGIDFDQFSLQLAWVGISSPNAAYSLSGARGRNSALLSLSRAF